MVDVDRNEVLHRWYNEHAGSVYAYLSRITGDVDDRQELVQETFVRAIRNYRRFDEHRDVRPWLLTIARHLAIDRVRRNGTRRTIPLVYEVPAGGLAPPEILERKDKTERLTTAIGALRRQDQEILHLYYYEELSTGEIADILAMPRGTIKFRLHRCRKRLEQLVTGRPTTGRPTTGRPTR